MFKGKILDPKFVHESHEIYENSWFPDYIKAGSDLLNSQTSELLERLSKHKDARVRRRLAENRCCPKAILEALSRDAEAEVRSAVALNSETPVDVVFALALDTDPTVRFAMAEDLGLPSGVLRVLLRDENPYVSCRARKTLSLLRRKWRRIPERDKENVIDFPGTDNEMFA